MNAKRRCMLLVSVLFPALPSVRVLISFRDQRSCQALVTSCFDLLAHQIDRVQSYQLRGTYELAPLTTPP